MKPFPRCQLKKQQHKTNSNICYEVFYDFCLSLGHLKRSKSGVQTAFSSERQQLVPPAQLSSPRHCRNGYLTLLSLLQDFINLKIHCQISLEGLTESMHPLVFSRMLLRENKQKCPLVKNVFGRDKLLPTLAPL